VANIAVVKPDRARKVEDMLIMNAQRGAFSGRISEEQLIQMLETITEKNKTSTKVWRRITNVPLDGY
jgi:programmed cell death protein 5